MQKSSTGDDNILQIAWNNLLYLIKQQSLVVLSQKEQKRWEKMGGKSMLLTCPWP